MGRQIKLIISVYISWVFLLLASAFFIVNNISKYFKYILMLSVLITLLQICLRRGQVYSVSKIRFRNRLKNNMPAVVFCIVTLIVYMPGELYLNNMSEFQVAPSDFGKAMGANAIIVLGIYLFGSALFLSESQNKWFIRTLFAATLCGYIQNLFLNGHMMQMDGNEETWSAQMIWINMVIWIAILVFIVVVFERVFRTDIDKVYRSICIYISLVEIAALVYMMFAAKDLARIEKEYKSGYTQLTYDGLLEVSQENNVVVFVLDWFDEQLLEQLLDQDREFLSPLDGFTCYTNTTSQYAFTGMALPYLLTGVEWECGMSESEYCEFAFKNSRMIDDISENGYDIRIFTDTNYIDNSIPNIKNMKKMNLSLSVNKWLQVMLKCAKYKMAPLACKNLYWYTTDEVKNLFAESEDVYTADNDAKIYELLTQYGMRADNNTKNAFQFIHMRGAHPPFKPIDGCTDAKDKTMLSQAEGSMKVVFEYIGQMKALGIYDRSTIIITADHGENYLYDSKRVEKLKELNFEKTSSPILLVKNRNQNDTDIQYSSAPVSHQELIAEIMQSIDPELKVRYGRSLSEIGENEECYRFFVFNRYDLPYVKVMITGDVRNIDNWNIVEEVSQNRKTNEGY